MKYTQAFNYRVNIHLYKPSILVNEASVKPINNFCRLETEVNLKHTFKQISSNFSSVGNLT